MLKWSRHKSILLASQIPQLRFKSWGCRPLSSLSTQVGCRVLSEEAGSQQGEATLLPDFIHVAFLLTLFCEHNWDINNNHVRNYNPIRLFGS